MLNSHQILKGARTKGGIKTYVDAEYLGKPGFGTNTQTLLDIIGAVELDGVSFTLPAFDASTLNNVLIDGDYILSIVPKYAEPADRATAESAGLNYFVNTNSSLSESVVHYFIPAALEAEVAAAGGHNNLAKLRAMGAATPAQIQLLNTYEDQLERLSDPRYTGFLLEPVGAEYVATRIYPQDNRSKKDALFNKDNQEIELFLATQGYVAANRIVDTASNQSSKFNSKLSKVKRAFAFASESDAKADIDAVEIRLNKNDSLSAGSAVDLDGEVIATADIAYIALFEYYQPTYMSHGHEGLLPGEYDLYEKRDSSVLGRINPIYMARDFEIARVSAGRGMPLPALTKYSHPLPIAKFTKANGGESLILSDVVIYTPGKLDLV